MAKARIAVVGAGLMGHGIAQAFAVAGHEVMITDKMMASLASVPERILANLRELGDDESALDRVHPSPDLTASVRDADFVVEAVPEDLPLKRTVFDEIERAARPDAILASNTSVIPITKIMGGLNDKSRALGTHWWNPPYLVPLVEVIGTRWTSPATIERTMALHAGARKTPVHVKKDVPGFVGNRLQHALWREAIALVESGICDGHGDQGELRAAACGAGAAGERRLRRHRSDAGDPPNGAAGNRQPRRTLALSRSARCRRQARVQERGGVPAMVRAGAGGTARAPAATFEGGAVASSPCPSSFGGGMKLNNDNRRS
jgi:3-hydroxybutyryl-CoA dehydrogenase